MVTNEEDVPRFSLRRGARFQEAFRGEPESEAPDDGWLAGLGEDFDGAQTESPEDDRSLGQSGDTSTTGEGEVAVDQLEPEIALHRRFASGETAEEPEVSLTSGAQLVAPPQAPVGESGRSSYKRKLEELAALAFDPSSRRTGAPPTDSLPTDQVPEPVHADQPSLDDAVSALAENLADLEEVLARTAAACSVARMVLRQGPAPLDQQSSSPATSASVDRTPVVDLRDQSANSPEPGPRPRTGAHRHSPETTPALSRLITPLRRYGSVTLRDLLRPE
jgi:hypothetical protein